MKTPTLHLSVVFALLTPTGRLGAADPVQTVTLRASPVGTITARGFETTAENCHWWSRGALLTCEKNKSTTPIIHSFGSDSHDTPTAVSIPGATVVELGTAAHSAEGSLGVSGLAWDSQGHRTGFVAFIPVGGQGTTVIRMPGLFIPEMLALPDDGSIWVKGWESKDIQNRNINYETPLVRRFDKSGNQLAGFLPLSELVAGVPEIRLMGSCAFLASSSSRVGWLQACLGGAPYYEFVPGSAPAKFPQPPPDGLVTGFALTATGDAFVTTQIHKKGYSGRYIYRLNRSTNVWVQVKFSENSVWSPKFVGLLGAEGESLVFNTSPGVYDLVTLH